MRKIIIKKVSMKLSSLIFRSVFFISFMSACCAFFITVIFQYNSYDKNKDHLKSEFVKIQESKITLSVDDYILAQQKLIENEINKKEASLYDTIINQISSLILFILLATTLFYFISKKVSTYIDYNINHLIEAFKEATTEHKEININELTYKEFSALAQRMNVILRDRNRTNSRLKDYVKIVDDNVSISSSDMNGNITSVSNAFCKQTGYSKEELIGKKYDILRRNAILNEYYKKMWENLKQGVKWEGEVKGKKKNGDTYWAQTIIHPEYSNDEIISYTAIKHDITEKKKLETLSITDDLTGLYSRRYFNEIILDEINRAKRNDSYLSFLLMDIDYFKKYNDTYGHVLGDETLKKVTSVLKKHTNRSCDFAFRVGGEEFCLIFSSDDQEKSLAFSNLLKSNIEELNIEHKNSDVNEYLTASIGLVVKKGLDIINSREIFMEADDALYKAKDMGRNRVCLKY